MKVRHDLAVQSGIPDPWAVLIQWVWGGSQCSACYKCRKLGPTQDPVNQNLYFEKIKVIHMHINI